jgi:4-alpha-glucanotransferase
LLHVTSLPSPYGIGDLGSPAFQWIDRLHDAHQKWWQALPLGATGFGNSPYQSLSSFAGNPLLIIPGALISDGLLATDDCVVREARPTRPYSMNVIPNLLAQSFNNFRQFLLVVGGYGEVRGNDLWDRNLPNCLCNVFFRYAFALQ